METTLNPSKTIVFHRWGGAAFMVGNLLFLANKFNEMSRLFLSRWMSDVISGQTPGLIFIGQVALIIGILAFYRMYAPLVDRTGRIALGLFRAGGIVLAVSHIGFMSALERFIPPLIRPYMEGLFFLLIIGLMLLLVGLIWFGVLNLRRPITTRWHWLPLVTGLMGFIGFFLFSGEEVTAVFLMFRTLFALGLFGLGLSLLLERPIDLNNPHLTMR